MKFNAIGKAVALTGAVAMLASVAACGSSNSSNSSANGTTEILVRGMGFHPATHR